MEFLCICMSPAVDATVRLPSAPRGAGEIFKDVAEEENVGGKAVNVARWLALRGADVVCGGLLGEDNAGPFVRELAKYGIEDRFMRVPGPTRRNEMVTWPGGSFKLNRPAFPALSRGFDALAAVELAAVERMPGVAILSGSLPAAVPVSFYADAVAMLRRRGWRVVVDASGAPFLRAMEARPDLVKPNAEECAPFTGFVPSTPGQFAEATRLLRAKAACAIVSDGASGAWFDGRFVAAPHVEAVDTTAAGDTLLAEYCWRAYAGSAPPDIPDAAEWAVAAGSAACAMAGGSPPPVGLVAALRDSMRQAP